MSILGTIAVLFGLLVLLALGIWFLVLAFSRRRVRRVVTTTTVFDVSSDEEDRVIEELRQRATLYLQEYMAGQRLKMNLNFQEMLKQYGYDSSYMEEKIQQGILDVQRSAAVFSLKKGSTIRVVGEAGISYVINPTVDSQYATQVGTYDEPESALKAVEQRLGMVTQYQEIE